jgi:hypothetical protein
MSRAYSMTVTIDKYNKKKEAAITSAAGEEWPFEDWTGYDGKLVCAAEAQLCGGESEEEFAERLAKAIWRANGKFCEVEVNATYLDDLPYEIHTMDEGVYDLLKSRGELDKEEVEA